MAVNKEELKQAQEVIDSQELKPGEELKPLVPKFPEKEEKE